MIIVEVLGSRAAPGRPALEDGGGRVLVREPLRQYLPRLGSAAEFRRGRWRTGRLAGADRVRSEVNIELNFPPKLRGARSRLHRRRFLQVNTRWKALAEIYTMHSFAPFSNLNFFVKNRQNFFAIELMNIH